MNIILRLLFNIMNKIEVSEHNFTQVNIVRIHCLIKIVMMYPSDYT